MDLKRMFGDRFRVTLDPSFMAEREKGKTAEVWRYHEIHGRYGMVYPFSADQAAVYFKTLRIGNLFPALPIVRDGEGERVCFCPAEAIENVLAAIQARRRRKPMTPEQREAALARIERFRFGRTKEARQFSQSDENALREVSYPGGQK